MTQLAQTWTQGTSPLPTSGNRDALEVHRERWLEAGQRRDDAFAQDALEAAGELLDAVFGNSPYLSHSLITDLPFARLLIESGPDAAYEAALGAVRDGGDPGNESGRDLMKRLRVAKRQAALAIGMADIASVWPLERVTGALADFASAALSASCRHLLRELHRRGRFALPDPDDPEKESGLIVLGMGKLGARELNYSSDIDLILLFDPETTPYTGDGDLQQTFTRLARNLVSLMDERTADGYVFRTDLRLRPDPGSTAPAISTHAAEMYYESAGQNWERAAMIKARPVAGDVPRGEAFLEVLQPFMWRRHLDFAAIQDIQSIKRQINAHRGGGQIAIEGHNVKLGRGGIREIEFFAQTQQLIWGGRDRALRTRGTLEAIDKLVAAGHVARSTANELAAAYDFHRRLEHRLQMIDDRQTHSLPEDETELAGVAAFSGFDSTQAFRDAVLEQLRTVERHYAALFEDEPDLSGPGNLVFTGGEHDPDTLTTLSEMGYAEPERVSTMIRAWHTGRYRAMQNTRAREMLTELTPAILEAFSDSPDPDSALLRLDRLLLRLPAGIQLFSLFTAHPGLFELVAEIMGSAPRLANTLSRHPALLDSVLSRNFTDLQIPDAEELGEELADAARRGLIRLFYSREYGIEEMKAELSNAARDARDFQDFLEIERRWASDRIFQIGVHMLRGLFSPTEAGRPLSDIADVCLGALLPVIENEFAATYGRVLGGKVALVAFGKLGSREMTVSSDLDLMFVYDHDAEATGSDGKKSLSPGQYYAQLCRRFIGAVTAQTADGKLYEVDMRLRPTGNAGPIATSFEAFEKYQRSEAWTWEHQALTRARVVYAESDLEERIDAMTRSVLALPRNREELAGEVAGMRERIQREHGTDDIWSTKHVRGGLVDAEFIAQFLQLTHAAEIPEILAGDPISVFEIARKRELMDAETARKLTDAVTLWRNLQGILRLTVEGDFVEEKAPHGLKRVVMRSCGVKEFDQLKQMAQQAAKDTAAQFEALIGTPDDSPGDAASANGA